MSSPGDTASLIWEEKALMDWLRDRPHGPQRMWTMINEVAHQVNPDGGRGWEYKYSRQRVVRVLCRLIKDRKMVRNRRYNTVVLGAEFR